MPELAPLQTSEPVRVGSTVIHPDWRRVARWRFIPSDALDYSSRVTVAASSEPGTVGLIRARVVQTGRSTPLMVVTQPTGSVLLPALALGTGVRDIILEAKRDTGDGQVRILSAGAIAVLTSLAGTEAQPADASARIDLGDLSFTALAAFSGGPVNTVAPAVQGTPTEGATISVTTGTWSVTPAAYEFQWETV